MLLTLLDPPHPNFHLPHFLNFVFKKKKKKKQLVYDLEENFAQIHLSHYIDVIMTTMASQITSLAVVYSSVYSDANQRKHQSSVSLAFVWGIHRDRWIPRTKDQLRGKCFHLMTSSCHWQFYLPWALGQKDKLDPALHMWLGVRYVTISH